ncbi:MAG TPA: hypothetical protein VMD07_08785 [Candidatus Acidoferrales bacterium]|nr:hypothetical protein [Candidatus Acidoferrales bacterium]
MKWEDDDALDAALFALPLEEPPADLRASIFAATILRPAPLFSFRELLALGTVVAVTVWLIVAIAFGGAALFVHSLQAAQDAIGRAVANLTTLAWIAAGAATAIWLSIFTGFQSWSKVKVSQHR